MSEIDAALLALVQQENDELRERIIQLEEIAGLRLHAPIALNLTGSEAQIFGMLCKQELVTKPAIMTQLYSDRVDAEPQMKIADVFVCKLRAKLKPFGINIETVWGRGYTMPPAAKAAAAALAQGEAA